MTKNDFDADRFKEGQRIQWDGVAAGWEKWWETLEKMSQGVTDKLIQMADVKPDQNVLDIATGIGEPALTVARKVGDNGSVIATDQSPKMLSLARRRADAAGITNVTFLEIDAENMDFEEDDFDAVVCRWGLMFMPNLDTVLSSIRRFITPGGKFATSVWDLPVRIPFFSLAVHILQEMFQVPPPPPGTPTVSGLADGVIEEKMAKAGFKNIQTVSLTLNFEMEAADDYVQLMKDIAAPLNAMLANQTPEQRDSFWKTLADTAAQKYPGSKGGVLIPSVSLCVSAER